MIVWRKSSHSGIQNESDCVEVARLPGHAAQVIGLRDSKQPSGPMLSLSHREFRTLLAHVKADAPDH